MYKRKNINEVVNETIEEYGEVHVVCKLDERCAEVGLNVRELSLLTGIRYASLNELKNGKKVTLNLQHTIAVMVALKLKSFDELFELKFSDEAEEARFDVDAEKLHAEGVDDNILEKIRDNAVRLGRTDELRKEWIK